MKPLGHTAWAIPGGHIPLKSKGFEPTFTSRDELGLLNTGDEAARLELVVYYSDHEPVGPYRLEVPARRLRRVRLGDLIDPEAIPLDTPYACVIRSDVPIVVQFSRFDSSQTGTTAGLTAFGTDDG